MQTNYPAIEGFDDATRARLMLYQSGQLVHAPAAGVGLQPLDATLTALAGLNSTAGFVVQTGADTFTKRDIDGTTNEIGVLNSNGVAGNPTISLSANIDASKAFRRGNVLATVSQSGGTPTGGLIERGSNANGEYVRFADGTQVCWNGSLGTLSTDEATGNVFRSAATITWTFPVAFSATPICTANILSASATARWPVTFNPTTTTVVVRQFASVSSATGMNNGATAIGRWF